MCLVCSGISNNIKYMKPCTDPTTHNISMHQTHETTSDQHSSNSISNSSDPNKNTITHRSDVQATCIFAKANIFKSSTYDKQKSNDIMHCPLQIGFRIKLRTIN